MTLARQHGFITTGLEFVTEDACPLCDTVWLFDDLRAHLNEKLLSIEAIGKVRKGLDTAFVAIEDAIKERLGDIRKMAGYAKALEPSIETDALDGYVTRLEGIQTAIKEFREDHAKLDPAIEAVQDAWWSLPEDVCIFRDIRPPIPTTSAHLYRGIRPALTRCREALVFDISFLAFRHVVEGLSFGRIVRRVRAGRRCAPAGLGWHLRRWVH